MHSLGQRVPDEDQQIGSVQSLSLFCPFSVPSRAPKFTSMPTGTLRTMTLALNCCGGKVGAPNSLGDVGGLSANAGMNRIAAL